MLRFGNVLLSTVVVFYMKEELNSVTIYYIV
jgi:hypothetical protein